MRIKNSKMPTDGGRTGGQEDVLRCPEVAPVGADDQRIGRFDAAVNDVVFDSTLQQVDRYLRAPKKGTLSTNRLHFLCSIAVNEYRGVPFVLLAVVAGHEGLNFALVDDAFDDAIVALCCASSDCRHQNRWSFL